MIKLRIVLLCWIMLAAALIVPAQTAPQSLTFADTPLTLGLAKTVVTERLAGNFETFKVNQDLWLIFSQQDQQVRVLGSLSFQNDQLIKVSKIWAIFPDLATTRLADSLIANLPASSGDSIVAKTITLSYRSSRDLLVHRIDLINGNRELSIGFWSGNRVIPQLLNRVVIARHIKNEPLLTIFDQKLALNLTKSELIKQLSQGYQVQDSNQEIVTIFSRTDQSCLALAYFQDNRLVGVSETVVEISAESNWQFAQLCYFLIASFNEQELSQATISLDQRAEEDLTVQELTLAFGQREIIIVVAKGDNGQCHVTVQEVIEQ